MCNSSLFFLKFALKCVNFYYTELSRRPFALKTYSYEEAITLIKKTKEWRLKKGFDGNLVQNFDYFLMPIK